MHDAVDHPSHYTGHASGVEVIEITEHLGFLLGNAVKYILRCDLKGRPVEDRMKCLWYIRRHADWARKHPIRAIALEYWRYCWGSGADKKINELVEHEQSYAVCCVLAAARVPTPINMTRAVNAVFDDIAILGETK